MTVRVQAARPEHYKWIAERAQVSIGGGFRAIEAVEEGLAECPLCKSLHGKIVAMVGFDGWTPNAVMLHIALDSPIALRHVLKPGFGLAFDSFKRGVVVATVLSSNRASLELVTHLGFREVMRGRNWWAPGVDLIWHEMRRGECRFLGQKRKAA